jgi:hypothetical protein
VGVPASAPNAEPNKEQYDLQERCGKQAKERFEKEYGNGVFVSNDAWIRYEFEAHHNNKMNKCFYLLNNTVRLTSGQYRGFLSLIITLVDINENKEYGSFVSNTENEGRTNIHCQLQESLCSSEAEWEMLLKPYMKE